MIHRCKRAASPIRSFCVTMLLCLAAVRLTRFRMVIRADGNEIWLGHPYQTPASNRYWGCPSACQWLSGKAREADFSSAAEEPEVPVSVAEGKCESCVVDIHMPFAALEWTPAAFAALRSKIAPADLGCMYTLEQHIRHRRQQSSSVYIKDSRQ